MTYEMFEHVNLGKLEPLLEDPHITEIMINGTRGVYIVKHGELIKTDITFEFEDHVERIIKVILSAIGQEIDERTPMIDTRLPDGSRVNAVIRPTAVSGPSLTLRRFPSHQFTWDELIGFGSVDENIVEFLQSCVAARRNIIVAGGTSSGKTTIFNAISELIPANERIITAEKMVQLRIRHEHVVALETRQPDFDGKGEITMQDLIRNAQGMRPDRILTSDVSGSEAWDMLEVMTNGYDGSMFTMHATSIHDVLERLEMMCTMATSLPLVPIRAKIAQAVDIIVLQMRGSDGTRKIVNIAEVVGLKNNVIETQDIFRFEATGERDGRVVGEFKRTGYRPTFADRLDLPGDFFEA